MFFLDCVIFLVFELHLMHEESMKLICVSKIVSMSLLFCITVDTCSNEACHQ